MPVSFLSRAPALALVAALAGAGTGALGADDAPPRPAPGDVAADYHGVRVAGPHRTLGDLALPAATEGGDATRRVLDRVPEMATLRRRVAGLDLDRSPLIGAVQVTGGGRWFYLKRAPAAGIAQLVVRETATATERVLLDPGQWQRDGGVAPAIADYTVSPDGRHVGVVVAQDDSGLGELRVFDVDSGQEELAPLPGVRSEAAPAWTSDSRSVMYVQSRGRPQLRQRALAGGPDRLLAGAGAPFGPPVGDRDAIRLGAGDATHWVVALQEGLSSDPRLYVVDADALARDPATARWTPLAAADATLRDWTVSGHWLYARSAKDAPRFRLVRYDLEQPGRAPITVVAQQRGVIAALQGAADGLYYTVRTASTAELFHLRTAAGARAEPVTLPFSGAITFLQASPRVPGVVVGLESWTQALQILTVRGAHGASTELVPPRNSSIGENWDSDSLGCHRGDGSAVPMTLVHRRALKRDGSHPVILAGHGSDQDPTAAFFDPRREAFLARGGIFADADPRAGGADGFAWDQAGVGAQESAAWKDMLACAQTLVDGKYTTPARLAIEGRRTGGVAAGRTSASMPDNAEFADRLAFVLWQTGDADFQPVFDK